MCQARGKPFAFTLVEVLVVVGIVAVIIAILMPTIASVRESANRIKCASNIHELVMAGLARAADDPAHGVLFPTPDGANDSLAYVYPHYIRDLNVALCPSTSNYIRTNVFVDYSVSSQIYGGAQVIQDLTLPAKDAGYWPGTSYEVFGWYTGNTIFLDGKTVGSKQDTVNGWLGLHPGDWGYNAYNDQSTTRTFAVPKRLGHLIDGSATILILDSDQDDPANTNLNLPTNNWPDANNNHGTVGLNVGFADGHVAFVRRGDLIRTYLLSHNDPGINLTFLKKVCPGISYTAATSTHPAQWVLH
jgi:prepilin-type processing-associated H-X9-DG protein